MANGIEDKLLAVITENLPQTHAGVLRDYLTKAAANEQEVEKLRERLKWSETVGGQAKEQRDTALRHNEALTKENDELKAQAIEVEQRRRNLDVTVARNDAAAARQERDTVVRLCEVVFRNPRFTHNEMTTQRHSEVPSSNGYSYSCPVEKSRTETTVTTTSTQE